MTADAKQKAHVSFLAELSPNLTVVNENDNYHHAVGIKDHGDEKSIRKNVDQIVKSHQSSMVSQSLPKTYMQNLTTSTQTTYELSRASAKNLAHLNDHWGLTKWPTVNPKNIRDKIYVILAENGKPMHFSEIAKSIKKSDFKRKDVTTQAIHNELIKDKRFVLIGRGIYALDSWGYSKGTVADIITSVLKLQAKPTAPRRNRQRGPQESPGQRNNYPTESPKQASVQACLAKLPTNSLRGKITRALSAVALPTQRWDNREEKA